MNPETPHEPPRPDTSPARGNPAGPKRIYRDPKGPLGGIASGFAGYFDIDPVISRLAWFAAAFSGVGIPAYFVCWLVIPKAKVWPPPGYQGRPADDPSQGNSALLSGFVIIGLAAVIGTGFDGVGKYLLPAALVGFGVYLLSQRGAPGAAREKAADEAQAAPAGGESTELSPWQSAAGGAAEASAPARAERTGLVTPTVLSLLAIGAGVAFALHAAGVVSLSVTSVAAGGLAIVGAGMLASLWFGRARGLVPVGIGLAVIMLGAATIGPWVSDLRAMRDRVTMSATVGSSDKAAMGDHTYAPQTLAELQPEYDLGMGKLTLDLTQIDFTGETRDIELNVGMGEATVIVPAGTAVDIHGDVGIGQAEAFGRSNDGFGATIDDSDEGAGAGQLDIELNVGLGKVEVRRGAL